MKLQTVEADKPEADEPKNPLRRRLAKDDFLLFCKTYHSDIFFDPVSFHLEMCADLQALILAPGHKRMARAAPRGVGKTTLGILATEWAILYGHKRCSVWFCENEAKATERADALQGLLLTNGLIADDFPEICAPLKIEGKSDWVDKGKKLPNGAWTLWRSIDGGNLGTLLDFMRPDLIVTDDPENVSTIRKTGKNEQSITAQKRFDRIDKEICFLPERGKGALLLITTIRSRGCLSDAYTDQETKPAWEGKVYSAINFGDGDFQSEFNKERDAMWGSFLALCGSKDMGKEPEESSLSSEDKAVDSANVSRGKFDSFAPKLKKALRFFASNQEAMRAAITELDPVRIPIWDFFWQVGSDSRGKEIVWSELQNQPLDDPFTKQMRFTEKQLWTHQIMSNIGIIPSTHSNILCAVVVEMDQIYYQCDACTGDFLKRHVFECGLVQNLGIKEALEFLFQKFQKLNPRHVAVDVSSGSGKNRGEWAEIVTHFCVRHRPWFALQDCDEWDEHQAARAMEKNWCVEAISTNPFGVVRWHSVHFKNRLAAAYNNPEHPITFFGPDIDDQLHRYIRSQTSEQYTLEFIPDKTAKKSKIEKWVPVPKYRNMTQFWKTAAMIECLADIAQACKPRENRAATLVRATKQVEPPRRRF